MNVRPAHLVSTLAPCLAVLLVSCPLGEPASAEVTAYKATVTIPTYPWQDDLNPKFWALETGSRLSTTVKGAITYPYTMQDHLSRTKTPRTYKALVLENEYLKITCLPELGGRLHAVLDKTENRQMFHLNDVIKPSMIAMRGAWISGGVEWNTGPHGHTVTIVSPVNALIGRHADGSAFLEISNLEKIFRTRWTVRVTLHPGKAYLDQRIRIENPTDGVHPYYFWNCTAFPNRPGTRFIYPMSLGTDHDGLKFFNWPVHESKDLTWLKNYEIYTSVFAVGCVYDFFGAYDVDADRGIVQVADHRKLPGKKAWTWGQWDFGRVAQENLSDGDGPYIEVQSGPLPTQSDYGKLMPHESVAWREFWYPVHGLGQGFEYATRDVAVGVSRGEGNLQLRLIATGDFPDAVCTLSHGQKVLLRQEVDLSPSAAREIDLPDAGDGPIGVCVVSREGKVLAQFETPLPIRKVTPPDPSEFVEPPDDQCTPDQLYAKGEKLDRDTNRTEARAHYEKALQADPKHVAALRGLAVLDLEAGLYRRAAERLEKAVEHDPDDGWSWYFLGVCRLRLGDNQAARRCGVMAVPRPETAALGPGLMARVDMRKGMSRLAIVTFDEALRHAPNDSKLKDRWLLATYHHAGAASARLEARDRLRREPTALVPRAISALGNAEQMDRFARHARSFLGEDDFELLELGLTFSELGLVRQASEILDAACVRVVPPERQSPLPHYYLAYFASLLEDERKAQEHLRRAAEIRRDFVFPSRPQTVAVLQYAVGKNPRDAMAHYHLGNLLGGLGRLDEAAEHWRNAVELDASLSVAWRNLGLLAAANEGDLPKAASFYRKAIGARPEDQTLYRDLAQILIADEKRPEAIALLEKMPFEGIRRADVIIMLAEAYVEQQRHTDCIDLLESTPYFVNWEGQDITRVLFVKAHMARGRQRFEKKAYREALEDFEAALTYPKNLGVGRSNRPEDSPAFYWKGKTLQALGQLDRARAAWKAGAALSDGSPEQTRHRKLCREAADGSR